jgi:hypothetical protein
MKQIEVAKKYLGQSELNGNVFTDDTELGRKLHLAGHKNGEAWCCYFQEAVFCEAFPSQNSELRKLFSASTIKTFDNFKEAGYDCHDFPREGDLVIWQRYVDGQKQWQGHAGLVVRVGDDGWFHSIEGNTNKNGEREGTSVMEKFRNINRGRTGLNVLGFITIPDR